MVNNLFSAISLLRFPNQNRTVFVPRTYDFRTKNIRFWDGNHIRKDNTTQPRSQVYQALFENERHFLHHFRAVFSGFCIFLMQNRLFSLLYHFHIRYHLIALPPVTDDAKEVGQAIDDRRCA